MLALSWYTILLCTVSTDLRQHSKTLVTSLCYTFSLWYWPSLPETCKLTCVLYNTLYIVFVLIVESRIHVTSEWCNSLGLLHMYICFTGSFRPTLRNSLVFILCLFCAYSSRPTWTNQGTGNDIWQHYDCLDKTTGTKWQHYQVQCVLPFIVAQSKLQNEDSK